jgi:hypothetical protein
MHSVTSLLRHSQQMAARHTRYCQSRTAAALLRQYQHGSTTPAKCTLAQQTLHTTAILEGLAQAQAQHRYTKGNHLPTCVFCATAASLSKHTLNNSMHSIQQHHSTQHTTRYKQPCHPPASSAPLLRPYQTRRCSILPAQKAARISRSQEMHTCVFCATAASLSNTLSPAPGVKRLCSSRSMLLK